MQRRQYQRGSLSRRRRNGKMYWYAQWREEALHRSRELGLCSSISLFEAQSLLADIVRPLNESKGLSHYEAPTDTVDTFVERVYLPIWGSRWKLSTAKMETDRIRHYILRPLGSRPLKFVTRAELQELLNASAASLSRSVIDHMRFRLRSIFELAVGECMIERNPATALYTPRHCQPGRPKRVLTSEQFRTILDALNVREQAIVRLATIEGMRPGEVLALRVADLDFASSRISVKRRVYRGNIDLPKTLRSIREIGMSDGTAELLKDIVNGFGHSSDSWIFPSEDPQNPIWRENVWARYLQPVFTRLDLRWATFQVMRRTYATRSSEIGVDARTRAAQMGNTVNVNENEYAMIGFADRLEAVRKLEVEFMKTNS